jgi:hypothetical protein
MTSLMTEAIRSLVEQEADLAAKKARFIERMKDAPDRGTGGVLKWTRDELHER